MVSEEGAGTDAWLRDRQGKWLRNVLLEPRADTWVHAVNPARSVKKGDGLA